MKSDARGRPWVPCKFPFVVASSFFLRPLSLAAPFGVSWCALGGRLTDPTRHAHSGLHLS